MIEITIILFTILAIFLLKQWGKCWRYTLTLRKIHRDKFFEIANDLIDSDHIANAQLDRIAFYSQTMMHPKSIDIVIEAMSEVIRDKKTGTKAPSPDIPVEIAEQWSALIRHWSLAVMSQPSYKGFLAFVLLLKITLTDKEIADTAPHIVKSYARQHLTAA
jgi:hypothetical protein